MNKEHVIKTIGITIAGIDGFIRLDQQNEIITDSESSSLLNLKENVINLQRKLKTSELEVAVVGLEKAGKSMFSSAFVGKPGLFPSADERCTFTSTKLQYAQEDCAIVEFYSRKEFTDKFEKILKEIEFPNGKFDTIQLDTFKEHFTSLKETNNDLYNKHSSKTETDIEDIIEGRDKITKQLGLANIKFSDMLSDEVRKYITDKHLSRAVKTVSFYSNNLEGLENIILYDVPGFDSPTQVHLEQTIKKCKLLMRLSWSKASKCLA